MVCAGQGPRTNDVGTTVMAEVPLAPLISLVAGILIFAIPRLLNYIVAIYLILVGLLGLLPFV